MNRVMMEAAQRHEVGRFRLAAVRPVLDMMRIDVTRVRAAGKAAAFVAGVQHAAERSGNGPRLAADVERLAVVVFDQRDHARIAGEPTRAEANRAR